MKAALAVPLGNAARRAYLGENAERIFGLAAGLNPGLPAGLNATGLEA